MVSAPPPPTTTTSQPAATRSSKRVTESTAKAIDSASTAKAIDSASTNKATKTTKATKATRITKSTKQPAKTASKSKQPVKSKKPVKKAKSPTPESDEDESSEEEDDDSDEDVFEEKEKIKPAKKQPAKKRPAAKQPAKTASKSKQPAKSNPRAKKAKSPAPESDDGESSDEEDEVEEEKIKPTKKQPAKKQPATKKPAAKQTATKQPATKQPATKQPATKQSTQTTRGTSTTRRPTTRSRKGLASTEEIAEANGEATEPTAPTEPIPSATIEPVQDTTTKDPSTVTPATVTPAAESSTQTQEQTDEELARALQAEFESEASSRRKRTTRPRTTRIRVRTDLPTFFPDYEVVMGFAEKEAAYLDEDVEMMVIDDEESASEEAQASSEEKPADQQSAGTRSDVRPNDDGNSQEGDRPRTPPPQDSGAFTGLWNCQRLDFSTAEGEASSAGEDPLPETMYFPAHDHLEQEERRRRNAEEAGAIREREKLEKTLRGLKGPDWLRELGISGVSGVEREGYKTQRDHFVKEGTALLERLKAWNKLEKEERTGQAQVQQGPGLAQEKRKRGDKGKRAARPQCDGADDYEADSEGGASDGDAQAAWQLHREAAAATPSEPRGVKRCRLAEDESEGGSFFAKRHQREAAVGGHRRGRGALAFGHPIPDMAPGEFRLPGDVLTDEAIATRARLRRRLRRGV
ncbi:MAG: hypothetical protein M1816_008227 [Peltula sp. TS41687]|nr:MAG: hypothetical protein M1816_008227 [Peltula sp. TS41687]